MQLNNETRRILLVLFLSCLAFISGVSAQSATGEKLLEQARREFYNGKYAGAIEIAAKVFEDAKRTNNKALAFQSLDITAGSQISLQKYDEAETSLNAGSQLFAENAADPVGKAQLFLRFAWLRRSQQQTAEALNYSKKAAALTPGNRQILAEHYLNVGRVFYKSGYDISAIIWLEKAENLLKVEKTTGAKLDVLRFLMLAWWAKLNYQKALKYAEETASEAEESKFKYKHRQALFDWSTILSEAGQKTAAFRTMDKGLKLALAGNNSYQAGIFLSSLLLNSLDNDDLIKAPVYLKQLEKLNDNEQFSFEILLGKAVIFGFTNQSEKSREFFTRIEKMENTSAYILPGWRLKIARNKEDWNELIKINRKFLDLTLTDNFRDELPIIHFNFAEAYFHLDKIQSASEHLEKSLAIVEEIRQSENNGLSLGILETYHNAYRLLTQIRFDKPAEAFESADILKARLLKDRIDNAAIKYQPVISPALRQTLEELSLKYLKDPTDTAEIERCEKFVTNAVPELSLAKPDLTELDKIADFDDTAIVSYFFTLDKKLTAFVREKGQPIRIVNLPVSETEIDILAKTTEQKIKSFIFFKRDGKEIYDQLLKPLNLSVKHLIIVPDKSLWKIPFQALSADGEKYLIEDKLISYAPSVSILLEQIKGAKPKRQTLQAFANPSYNKQFLQFAASEAAQIAEIYNSKPLQNATVADFERNAANADILHFSMHAQVDSEQPLRSFLGFKKSNLTDDGRLTVNEILKIKLKKGSLAFLASCDTNNVLNGEGLVSLAWAIMGSGATTVVSAQWEANDKSTEVFTKTFYTNYKQGDSSAEALQKASLDLIKNKSSDMHAPYYWANFTLNGDYR